MSIPLDALRSELAGLQAELAADPRLKKVEHLRALIALYGEHPERSAATPPAHSTTIETGAGAVTIESLPGAFKAVSKISRFRELATRELQKVPTLHRKELLRRMVEAGVMGEEKNLIAAFASNMYQSKHYFESDGRGNFRLKKDGDNNNETGGAGLFNRTS